MVAKPTHGFAVLLEVVDGVVVGDAVLLEELVDLHAGAIAEEALDLALVEMAGAVGVDGEGFEGGAGGVLAGGAELVGEGVRDVEGHLHGDRVHPRTVGFPHSRAERTREWGTHEWATRPPA